MSTTDASAATTTGMKLTPTEMPHISLDERGIARVAGTRSKVMQVAIDHEHRGWSPAEIHYQYPHLSLAAIHAALSYYFDHQAEIDEQIRSAEEYVESERAKAQDSPLQQKFRELRRSMNEDGHLK